MRLRLGGGESESEPRRPPACRSRCWAHATAATDKVVPAGASGYFEVLYISGLRYYSGRMRG
jgi:hypothetical protein